MLKPINVFKPFGWQLAPLRDKNPVMLLTGGAGGGKSLVAAEKIHAYLLKYPNATGLLLRKARETLKNSTLLLLEHSIMGKDPRVIHKKNDHRFEYSNGSIFAYGGLKDEAQREAIRSIGKSGSVDIVWMEEANAFKEEDYNEVLARMRGKAAPWRQVILSTNPDKPTHWINKRIILGGGGSVYYSKATDNPSLDEQYLQTLKSLTGVQKLRLCDGLWVQAEGVVYDSFEPETHVYNEQDILWRDYKEFIAGGDSNYPLPRTLLLIGVRGNGEYDIIAEFHQERCEVETAITWLEKMAQGLNRNILLFHDPSDPQSITKYDRGKRITCEKAKNAVIPGISIVAGLFNHNKIRIHKSCVHSIKELQSYCWKKGKEGEEVVKEDDHLMDCLRYGLYSKQPTKKKIIGGFI